MYTILLFLRDRRGASAIEYGLIAAVVCLALIVGATNIGGTLNATYMQVATQLS